MTELQMLEKILDMVGKAGEGAYSLALVYLLEGYFITLFWIAFLVFVVIAAYRLIASYSTSHVYLVALMNALGRYSSGYFRKDSLDSAVEEIHRLREESINKAKVNKI
jgi:hypothetical protein